ncbi:TDP-N-acetylfucosamine:lipid II N-acetylfucosaminyltransferase [Microbacterium kyungheense]|uniref:TDP-N-acetylfucosamine:lipid II N-acetylfucosaminyltransferase n=1 Tax=Microbacterium kyungheense TaxID=1263636 RepID=UPI00163C7F1C|nr:TDP-N-acetylfucosamine:lipid II N-acetylfucosaminyltransferase [Microbacterium kyungheense]
MSSTDAARTLRYPIASEHLTVVGPGLIQRIAGLRRIRAYDAVIFHNMTNAAALGAVLAHPRATVVWSGYGWDYYGDGKSIHADLLDPMTAAIDAERKVNSGPPLRKIKAAVTTRLRNAAAKRTDLFSAPIDTDYEVFQRRFPHSSAEYIQLNYAALSDLQSLGGEVTGEDIIVGNSADVTNNHLDVFAKLGSLPLDGRKVVVPLSYDGDPAYISAVVSAGRNAFGGDFVPLVERVPFDEYAAIVMNCRHAVMGQRRQKALGNIIISLWAGADVILHDDSPVYTFLAEHGAVVRRLSDLVSDGFAAGRLDDPQTVQNRLVLEALWGDEVVKQNVANVIRILDARAA